MISIILISVRIDGIKRLFQVWLLRRVDANNPIKDKKPIQNMQYD